jgi:hypothetical protein
MTGSWLLLCAVAIVSSAVVLLAIGLYNERGR